MNGLEMIVGVLGLLVLREKAGSTRKDVTRPYSEWHNIMFIVPRNR
jgi:hypothetical protein